MVDALRNVDQLVSDETMVLAALRGLNEKFTHLATSITMQRSFPSFLDTRSSMIMEDL